MKRQQYPTKSFPSSFGSKSEVEIMYYLWVKHARLEQSGVEGIAGYTTMLALMMHFVSYA